MRRNNLPISTMSSTSPASAISFCPEPHQRQHQDITPKRGETADILHRLHLILQASGGSVLLSAALKLLQAEPRWQRLTPTEVLNVCMCSHGLLNFHVEQGEVIISRGKTPSLHAFTDDESPTTQGRTTTSPQSPLNKPAIHGQMTASRQSYPNDEPCSEREPGCIEISVVQRLPDTLGVRFQNDEPCSSRKPECCDVSVVQRLPDTLGVRFENDEPRSSRKPECCYVSVAQRSPRKPECRNVSVVKPLPGTLGVRFENDEPRSSRKPKCFDVSVVQPLPPTSREKFFPALVRRIVSPEAVVVNLAGYPSYDLQTMLEIMNMFYSKQDSGGKDGLTFRTPDLVAGALCAYPHIDMSGSKQVNWCRGVVTSVLKDCMARVTDVDSGVKTMMPVTRLRQLASHFRSLPQQAITVKLWGLRPAPGGMWDPEVSARLAELVWGQTVMCRLVNYENGVPGVLMCDTNGREDVHINSVLIEECLALPVLSDDES
ncbi:uncharacterized protein LOC142814277 [Rhipicephalus microplus]|uniref:uncharacterized protein LOC142814277 n=1 Tax=Rhipicephalus microplus TaxID=6941 RepID=UPI003F6C6B7A